MKRELCQYTYNDPESVTCRIHKEGIILLSGPCALLMQLAHPLIAAAIYEHSLVMSHPFHRAVHTIRLTQRKALGSDNVARHAARTINRLHAHVHGTLAADAGAYSKGTPYRAQDPQLLLWVHATLVVSALRIYELFIGPLSDGEKEQYYQETKARVCLLGLPLHMMPRTLVDLEQYIDEMLHSNRLAVTPQARQLVQKVLFPSSSPLIRSLAQFNLFVTSALLPPSIREMFGLQWNERQQHDFDRLASGLRAILPSLPECMRELPSTRRMIRQLQSAQHKQACPYKMDKRWLPAE
jgi:uncharacterized protein (DUF2236 family)